MRKTFNLFDSRCLTVCILCGLAGMMSCSRAVNQEVAKHPQPELVPTEEILPAEKPPKTPTPSISQTMKQKPPTKRPTLDERILFQPADASRGNYEPKDLQFEDVMFAANDGTRLHGWYCPCDNPRAYVLFAHGNAGNLSYWAARMLELQRDYRVTVFLFDYRGYGKSAGKPTVAGVLEDARAAARILAEKSGVEESDLVVMGQSLGGAVAVHLAAQIQPRGLILESTFSSFRDVADYHAKWISWMVPRNKLDSAAQIGRYRGPLLQCHGDADTVVPYALGQQLFQAAGEPKTFITMPGRGHNTPLTREYRWKLDDFFKTLAKNQTHPE